MPLIVLLDTNVWVSAFINPVGIPAQLRQAWYAERFQVAVSLPLLEELADVLSRPRLLRKYPIATADVQTFIELLSQRAVMVAPAGTLHVCRDPDDDVVLETALLANAQYVVTRDDDIKRDQELIEQLAARGITTLSVQQFVDTLAENEL